MKKFMDENFLLTTKTAQKLYFDCAQNQPIIDYHCHVSPKEIYEDKKFTNLFEVWLSGDHYKWRIMRSNGVSEEYITGSASPRDKFQKFAEALPKAIGNPMYHWCHLELKKYFGYDGVLNGETAQEVWNKAKEKLKDSSLSVRGIIKSSNVEFIGTTDDPIDSLEWHKKLLKDDSFTCTVAPTFRPDKALNLDKDGWGQYIKQLAQVSKVNITDLNSLKEALKLRMDHFETAGCKASDHGLDYFMFSPLSENETDKILKKALKGKSVSLKEIEAVKSELLLFCAKEYAKRGWVLQLHYNCLRNPNTKMFSLIGADTGFDCIGPNPSSATLPKFLDALYKEDSLPKTIVYSLDAGDNAFIDTIIGAFQGTECAGKIQHGSAWWFNDNKQGMIDQLTSLANLSLLGNFVGMLTDSRSFLSYTRHEYFRRILCSLIGSWVENGEYPNDEKALEDIITGICYKNAKNYFNL